MALKEKGKFINFAQTDIVKTDILHTYAMQFFHYKQIEVQSLLI